MDKNAIIGAILIALIILGSTYYFSPSAEETKKQERELAIKDSIEKVTRSLKTADKQVVVQASPMASSPVDSQQTDSLLGVFKPFTTGTNEVTIIENDEITIGVQNKGGRIAFASLKKYKTYQGNPIRLMDTANAQISYGFMYLGNELTTSSLYFKPTNVTTKSVTMEVQIAEGQKISIEYELPKEGYMVNQHLSLLGFDKIINKRFSYIDVHWASNIARHERDLKISRDNTTIHYRPVEEDPDYLSETSNKEETFKTKTQWVSFKEQFFAQTLISEVPFIRGDFRTLLPENESDTFVKTMASNMTLPFEHKAIQKYNFQWYLGPLDYKKLSKLDMELERQIPLGWSFFLIAWINRFIIIPIFGFLSQFIGNFGLIIFILTLFIKLITWPFTYKSYLSMAKMRLLKPDLDIMRQKYGDDMARQQQEQMKIYKQAGVSPFGGCLPLLLQFPILIAMFRFFPSSIELRQESFLWATDLSTYDSIWDFTNPPSWLVSIYGDHVSLFTLLMTVSTILQTHFNSAVATSPEQQQFKWMGYVMPIFFLGLFNKYASGLSLYYFLFNMVTFAQQFAFRRFIDDAKLQAVIDENKKKPQVQKKSSFQQKLEAIQKQQKELQKQKNATINKKKK